MTEAADLGGLRVVVTRAAAQGASLLEAIDRAGGTAIALPLLHIEDPPDGLGALRHALARLQPHDWLAVTSPNGASRVLRCIERDHRCRLAVIASGTGRLFSDVGWIPDFIPEVASSQGMVDAFPEPSGDGRVLIAQGDAARPTLADGLREAGWPVEIETAYRNIQPGTSAEQRTAAVEADVVVFASPSAVERHHVLLGPSPAMAVCIGSVTTQSAEDHGFQVLQAEQPSVEGLLAAIRRTTG